MFGEFLVNLQSRNQLITWERGQTYEGVYRRKSSTFKLGRLKRDEDNRSIAPASVAYSRRHVRCLYTLHGAGLLFLSVSWASQGLNVG